MLRPAFPAQTRRWLAAGLLAAMVWPGSAAFAAGTVLNERWGEVEKKVEDGLANEAYALVEKIYAQAKAEKDQANWTRAVFELARLKTGVYEFEKAVELLRTLDLPDDPGDRGLLLILRADLLRRYYEMYRYDVLRRQEKKEATDFREWSARQIWQACERDFETAWSLREALGRVPAQGFARYVEAGTYPENVRPTLRDFLVRQWAELLANQESWTPEQSEGLGGLDGAALAGSAPRFGAEAGKNPGLLHPLARLAYICEDLAVWHDNRRRPEAALDARLERVLAVNAALTDDAVTRAADRTLEQWARGDRRPGWWSFLQYRIAQRQEAARRLADAVRTAEAGEREHPETPGGRLCRALAARLKAPSFRLTSAFINPARGGRVRITHRNLKQVFFRVYDLTPRVAPPVLPASFTDEELRKILDREKPVASFTQTLTETGDYADHETSAPLDLPGPGWYLVAASAAEGFPQDANRIETCVYVVSEISLVLRQRENGAPAQVYCTDAATGRPVAGATIEIYAERGYHALLPQRLLRRGVTDAQGCFEPGLAGTGSYQGYHVLARYRKNVCADPATRYMYSRGEERPRSVFLFTDRAIYRPDQEVKFKALAVYAGAGQAQYRVLPGTALRLRVLDPNGESFAEFALQTNAWGSASGAFTIPRGRLLGAYRLQVVGEDVLWSARGGEFKVEEYKLPKFTVALDGPKAAMRLDRPAVLAGHAEYYYGGPVRGGRAAFVVRREPVLPWWFAWFRPGGGRYTTDNVARGTTAVDAQGRFEIAFTPRAVESLAGEADVRYNFSVSVTVTDEGGDSITENGAYPVGKASLQAGISAPDGFQIAGEPFELTVRLTDLAGRPRSGRGSLQIFPLRPAAASAAGDALTDSDSGPDLAALTAGPPLPALALVHDEAGIAKTARLTLEPGVYRVEYKTQDPFGQDVTAKQFVQVAPADGQEADWPAALTLLARSSSVAVGDRAEFLIGSVWPGQSVYYEVIRNGRVLERRVHDGLRARRVTFPVDESLRGGFTIRLFCVRGYRLYLRSLDLDVPWDNKDLDVAFLRLREKLAPGERETVTLKITGPKSRPAAAEVLAAMTDQALEYFAPHAYPDLKQLFPGHSTPNEEWCNRYESGESLAIPWYDLPDAEEPRGARFAEFAYLAAPMKMRRSAPGGGMRMMAANLAPPPPAPEAAAGRAESEKKTEAFSAAPAQDAMAVAAEPAASVRPPAGLRSHFRETAFFEPQLVTDDRGEVSIRFQAPDSVTAWNLAVYAHGRALESGQALRVVRTQKDFMVRPYLPRFLREGDAVEVKTAIENQTEQALSGTATLRIEDESGADATPRFKLPEPRAAWTAKGHGQTTVSFRLTAPAGSGLFKIRISATSGVWTDGEERPLPLLPSRLHLIESRFAVLKDDVKKVIDLPGLRQSAADPSLIHESLVVTADGQLILTVLKALPYLYQYPYECVEQTLNRFTTMAILHGTFNRYPSLAAMAKSFAARRTPLETWDAVDPNRKLALEETPWLTDARGGGADDRYANTLDPRVVRAQTQESLAKLVKAQLPDGSFPWFPGGRSDFYMTLYLLGGLARARAAGVEVPDDVVLRALRYCASAYEREVWPDPKAEPGDGNLSLAVNLNYVLSAYGEPAFQSAAAAFDRRRLTDLALKHWRRLSPYGRAMLAMTLQRSGDAAQAAKVLNSLLDTARTTETEGTFWAPEPKAWLWYNDTIESHAFILEAMLEIRPDDPRTDGMALWLLRHKQGNQWKSTRATAEAVYALVKYMARDASLEAKEQVVVRVSPVTRTLTWEPGNYSGKQQVVLAPEAITPESGAITLDKTGKGYLFASATWQYSTEKLPSAGDGDVLAVSRKYYAVRSRGREELLVPLGPGERTAIGEAVEVELTLQARTPMEYVHLRDPRGAGFEPEEKFSGYRWEELGYYEEVRDSATNFFFGWLPQGTYTFRYRVRAANGGAFRVGPATLQSLYAPEFAGRSAGAILEVRP